MSQSANTGSDASVSSVDDSNLSDDSARFDEEVEENSSSDKEILLPRGPLVRRQAKMRGGSSAKKLRTRGRGSASVNGTSAPAPVPVVDNTTTTTTTNPDEWSKIQEAPPVFPFNQVTGLTSNALLSFTEIDPVAMFNLMVDENFLNMMVDETNRFAEQTLCNETITQRMYSRLNDWYPIDMVDLSLLELFI